MLDFLLNAVNDVNIKALQTAIRKCEGTDAPDGFNYLFGSSIHNTRRFTDMSHHPNQKFPFGKDNFSDAAGAYQIMYATEQGLIKQLVSFGMTIEEATRFDEATQNLKCVLLFSNHNCCQRIMNGDFDYAIGILNKTWASLPGSPYGQPTHDITEVTQWYQAASGNIIA